MVSIPATHNMKYLICWFANYADLFASVLLFAKIEKNANLLLHYE